MQKARLLFVALVAFVVLFPGAVQAQTTQQTLTRDLVVGDEGEEVILLQTWLATDPELYPEGSVEGVYGPATERAVQRYQRATGLVFLNTKGVNPYGNVGPLTRADLNMRFAQNHNGVAFVEGSYSSVAKINDADEFVQLEERSYEFSSQVRSSLEAWVLVKTLPTGNTLLFTNEQGDRVGVAEGGKLYGRTNNGALGTSKDVQITEGTWQHVAFMFTDTEVIVVVNNEDVEIVPLVAQENKGFFSTVLDGFFGAVRTIFLPSHTTPADVETTRASLQTNQETGFFTDALSFIKKAVGIAPAPTPTVVTDIEAPEPTTERRTVTATPPQLLEAMRPVNPTAPQTSSTAVAKQSPSGVTSTPTTTVTTVATSTATTTPKKTLFPDEDVILARKAEGRSGGGSSSSEIPEIRLLGSNNTRVTLGTMYTDPGATAKDDQDGDLTSSIRVGGDSVDHNTEGEYRITYNVTDASGNAAPEVVRIVTVEEPNELTEEEQTPRYPLAEAGQKVSYTVSSGSEQNPVFTSVEIDPLHVYVGQTQTFTVKVTSPNEIVSVTATTELDNSTLELELEEVSPGTYEVSWVVYDTHVRTYHTTFTATADNGDENQVVMAWTDPCSGINQGGSSTTSADCVLGSSEVYGLDGGNVTINHTITLGTNSTWAWNPGTSIIMGTGQLVKGSGAQIRKGYLFYLGCAPDCAQSAEQTVNIGGFNTLYFFTSTPQSGYVQVSSYSQSTYEFMYLCLVPETPILMSDGTERAIRDIKLGDIVMGKNDAGELRPNVVTHIYNHGPDEHPNDPLGMLKINGALTITPEHVVYTKRGWIPAGEVVLGDVMTRVDGEMVVTSIERVATPPHVYNLTTYPTHTYFANGTLVHNGKGHCTFC